MGGDGITLEQSSDELFDLADRSLIGTPCRGIRRVKRVLAVSVRACRWNERRERERERGATVPVGGLTAEDCIGGPFLRQQRERDRGREGGRERDEANRARKPTNERTNGSKDTRRTEMALGSFALGLLGCVGGSDGTDLMLI